MIVYLTRDTTDFARELRARFLAEGHSVYTGDALAALPAIDLFLATQGYIKGRTVPIVVDGIQSVEAYINPIPAGLVLTGIVVSVSVSALMLALSIRLYYRYNTLNLDEIIALSGKEEV